MSFIVRILCYYDGKIINSDNGITHHGGSTELCSLRLDSSFNEFKNLACQGVGWNLSKFDVDIT